MGKTVDKKSKPNLKKPKKKKSRKVNVDFLQSIQVPLSNKFESLNEDDNNIAECDSSPLKQNVSPLVITDHNTDINKIITDLSIECQFKLLSIGRKIICSSIADKNKLSTELKAKKINFFSHPENENKVFKVVLSGLPEVPIKTIEESLKKSHNIAPLKIILFNTNSPNKLYLCHFNKNEVSMKSLNTITSVYHHIIKWQPYKPKYKGPTQCYRCCMFGHGASSCNRYQACLLCGSNHTTKECNLPNTNNPIYRCFNCASAKLPFDHKANDLSCPFRAKYEHARNNARDKTKRKPLIQAHANNGPHKHKYVVAPTPPPLTASFASQVAPPVSARAQTKPTFTPSNTQHATPSSYSNSDNSNNDLFTFDEISDLLFSSIDELEKCTSKLQQLRVIANLLRHVCK